MVIPNVYWELGVRQSFNHCTIAIIDETSRFSKKIPFDVSTKAVLSYSKKDPNKNNFSKSFENAIKDCLENPKRPDSEVLESITGRPQYIKSFIKKR